MKKITRVRHPFKRLLSLLLAFCLCVLQLGVAPGRVAAEAPEVYEPDYSAGGAMGWDVALDAGVVSELTAQADGSVKAEAFKGHAIDTLSPSMTDGTIEFTVNISSAASFAVLFRAQDQKNLSALCFDYGNAGGRSMFLQNRIDGTDGDIPLNVVKDPVFGGDMKIKLELAGEAFKLWVDDVLVLEASGAPVRAGHFGFRIWDGWNKPAPDVTVKDVRVTPAQEQPEDPDREPVGYTPDYTQDGAMNWDVLLDGGVSSELIVQPDGSLAAEAFKGHAIDLNSPEIADGILEFTVNVSSPASFALLFRAEDQNNLSYVAFDYGNGSDPMRLQDRTAGVSKDTDLDSREHLNYGQDTRVKLIFNGTRVTIYKDGMLVTTAQTGRTGKGHIGFRIWDGPDWGREFPDVVIKDLKLTEIIPQEVEDDPLEAVVLTTEEMTVLMDNRFPSVYEYQIGGKTVAGQRAQLRTVTLNGAEYYAANVQVTSRSDNTVEYSLDVLDATAFEPYPAQPEECGVLASLKIGFTAEALKLRMDVLEIAEQGDFLVRTIAFPGQYFGTVKNSGGYTEAQARMTTLTTAYGGISESSVLLSANPSGSWYGAYAVIHDDSFAVTMESNVIETTRKVLVETKTEGSDSYMALTNGAWTYRGPGNDDYWGTEELPWAVVALTGDCNGDQKVDWQDGAIRYREMAVRPLGSDEMKNYISYIFMNCMSGASMPFMRQLDTIKTMYNYYDGFGQMILEKGYNGEGHDDVLYDLVGHVNERAGGEEDFQYLLARAKDFNAKIGVHINVNEYTLDSFFLDDQYLYKPLQGGWGYLDQSYKNNKNLEILEGAMDARMQEFCDAYPDMGWVYIDVFDGIDWYADKMAESLNRNGLPVGTEYRGPMEKDMVWVHNSTDIHYPVSHPQDTPMYRFIKNGWGDIFPPHELLKNLQQPAVGAWEHTTNFNEAVEVFYNNNLATKYMQHQDIMQMSSTEVVFDRGLRVVKENNASLGLGERVNLYQNGVLIASLPVGNYRPVDNVDRDTYINSMIFIPWYAEDSETKDPLDADKIYYWNALGTSSTWELPPSWAGQKAVKLYELTNTGRVFVKAVPVLDGKVTIEAEKGVPYIVHKADETVVTSDQADNQWGENTLIREPGFDSMNFENWEVEGDSAVNGFTDRRDSDVKIAGEDASLRQEITGLVPGENYTISVWTDVRGDMTSLLTVRVGDRTLTDYVGDTSFFVRQERNHKYGYTTYEQLRVNFTVPEDVTGAVIELSAKAGENASSSDYVRFDDVRAFQSLREVQQSRYTFFEDFENVPENLGPFLYATPGYQSIEQAHLAEKNPDPEHPQIKNYVVDGRFSLKMNNNALSNARILRTVPSTLRLEPNTTYEMGLDYFTRKDGTYQFSVKNGAGETIPGSVMVLKAVGEGETGTASVTFTTDGSEDCYVEVYQIGGIADIETEYLSFDNFYVNDLSSEVSVNHLNRLLEETDGYEKERYTAGSLAQLETARARAVELLKTTGCNIANDEVALAMDRLQAAANGLVEISSLQALYDANQDRQQGNYTDSTWKAFQEALAGAEAVLKNENASQADVDDALRALQDAVSGLQATDKSALQALYDANKDKQQGNYTDSTWKAFREALAGAEAVLKNGNASQADVEDALRALQDAVSGLQQKPDESSRPEEPGEPSSSEQPVSSEGGSSAPDVSSGNEPSTGADGVAGMWLVLLSLSLLCAGGLIFARRRAS